MADGALVDSLRLATTDKLVLI